jgi:Spo0E like sporulation regulatory protein.
MLTKLEQIREKLHKALEVYPFDSEIILKLSKELDQLICKSYVRSESTWKIQKNE